MIGIGVPVAHACRAVGLNPTRFAAWMDERDEDETVILFRDEVLRADGQGVAAQVKILWDGGKTVSNASGEAKVEVSKTICEQHRFLLIRRCPTAFGTSTSTGFGAPSGQGLGSQRADPTEPDVAEQIVAVLEASGVILPPEVLATIGLSERP